jgi:hypothetical protein
VLKPRLPTRVIDVGSVADVPKLFIANGAVGRYAALSYCWGQSQPYHLTRASLQEMSTTGLDMRRLPKTIQDAIEATRNLGLQYIWIDALCICQDADDDMAHELSNMSKVYKSAHVTISAASAANSGEGFLDRSPHPLSTDKETCSFPLRCKNGKIGTFILEGPIRDWSFMGNGRGPIHGRAWTLQEHWLSPRVLLYGSKGLSWLCHSEQLRYGGSTVNHFTDNLPRLDASWHEDLTVSESDLPRFKQTVWKSEPPRLLLSRYPGHEEELPLERIALAMKQKDVQVDQKPQDIPWSEMGDMDIKQWHLWESLVKDYTSRKLTNAKDKLPAVSALASEFGRMSKDDYLAGLWRKSLLDNLMWYTGQQYDKPKDYRAPSWSWAAVDGGVKFIDARLGWEFSDGADINSCTVELLDASLPYGQVIDGRLTISEKLRPVTLSRGNRRSRKSKTEHAMCDLFTEEELGSVVMDTTEFLGSDGVPPDVQLWALGMRWGSGPLPLDGLLVTRAMERPGLWRRVGAFFIGRIEKRERHKYKWIGIKGTLTLI